MDNTEGRREMERVEAGLQPGTGVAGAEAQYGVAEVSQGASEMRQSVTEMSQSASEMQQSAAEMSQVASEMQQSAAEVTQGAQLRLQQNAPSEIQQGIELGMQSEMQPGIQQSTQSELAKAALEAEQAIHQLVNTENGYQNTDKMPEGAVPFGGASEQQVNERLQEQQMQQDEEVGEGQMQYTMLVHDRLTKKAVQQTEEAVRRETDKPSELKKDIDRMRKEFIYNNYGWTPESEN